MELDLRTHKVQKMSNSSDKDVAETPCSSTEVRGSQNLSAWSPIHFIKNVIKPNQPPQKPKVRSFRLIDAPVPHFVGRSELIAKVHSLLTACSTKSSWLERTVIIYGLGGMGKSEVARKYVQLHINDPIIQNVAWIDSETKTSLENSFKKVAREFKINTEKLSLEEIAASVYRHFSKHCNAGMFVYDNVSQLRDKDPYFEIFKYLPTQQMEKLPLILITSRINDCEAPDRKGNTIRIHELGEGQSVQLLTIKLKLSEDQRNNAGIQAAVRKLAEAIQGYPLGLTLASANIRTNKFVNVPEEVYKYIARLDMPKSGWMDDEHSIGSASKYNLVIKNVWEATFEKIRSMGAAGECALTLLNIIAYLPADDIEKEIVDKKLEFGYPSLKDHAVEGYSYLQDFALVTSLEKNEWWRGNYTSVRVHRHVQRCSRERLDEVGDFSFLLTIGRYLCQHQDDLYNALEIFAVVHRHLKQRKWPHDSFHLSVIFLSRYWNYKYSDIAMELGMDLSEAIEAPVNAPSLESGYRTLLGMLLYLVAELNLEIETNAATVALLRQWKGKHEVAFDAAVEIFFLKDSLLALGICSDVRHRISLLMEDILDSDEEGFRIIVRDSLVRTLDGKIFGPQLYDAVIKAYQVLTCYDSHEPNQNSALALKTALQIHFQCYANDSALQNPQYWSNGPIKFSYLSEELLKSQGKRRNPSVATDWEKSIVDTFLAHGGLQVLQQSLFQGNDNWDYAGTPVFVAYLVTEHNCLERVKDTPSFFHALKKRTAAADEEDKHRYLLLWLALFPPTSTFEDAEGTKWSLESVHEEMEEFLEEHKKKDDFGEKLIFLLDEQSVIKALLPHLDLWESGVEKELHFRAALAFMDGDICYRNKYLTTNGWETIFKTRLSTRQKTPQELLEVGRTHEFI